MVDFRRLRDLGDLLELELLPFYLASFEESPESYLAPSRRAVWGYPAVNTIHGPSGVGMRCMRRHGSVWLVVSDRSSLSWGLSLQDELNAGRHVSRTIRMYVCLVVNGTSTFIINISSRHGC